MKIAIVNTNLNPKSKNAILSKEMENLCEKKGCEVDYINLAEIELPFCDGGSCYGDKQVIEVTERVKNSEAIIWCSPIYNYDLNAVAKNFLELTNSAWSEKVVGFICQAGGEKSYMSAMPFGNSLMLDHRCRLVSRFVYATGKDFIEGQLEVDGEVMKRLERLVVETMSLVASSSTKTIGV